MPDPGVIEDVREAREEALSARLGIARRFYLQAIQTSVTFTLAAVADGDLRPWRQWGARNIGGRIRAIAQNPRNPSQLYAGSAQGGVFRSDDAGDTWQPLGQPGDAFPVGAIGIAPSNPSIVFVGSGEPSILHDQQAGAPPVINGREAFAAGRGFYRFDAATSSFTKEVEPAIAGGGAGGANCYAAIAVDPLDPDRCWIASATGLWRRETGPAFNREPIPNGAPVAAPQIGAAVSDVVLVEDWDPNQPNTLRLFAALPGTGIVRGVYSRNPATMTWDPMLGGGLPDPCRVGSQPYDRIRIAVCKQFPNHVYAVYEKFGTNDILHVFHSSDGGDHWTERAVPQNLGTQAWCNLCIAVHPENPAVVVVGNVDAARSLDSGRTWQTIMDWTNFTEVDRAQHGDIHVLLFDQREPNRLWVGNDGGISMAPDVVNKNPSTDRTWRKRSHGLCISQFNDITSHPDYPFMLGGGLQDNGTYVTFGGPTWTVIGDADGGQMCFEVNNPRQFITPNQWSASFPRNLLQSNVVAGSAISPPGYPIELRTPNPDLSPAPNDTFTAVISQTAGPIPLNGLFVQNVLHHRSDPGNALAGRTGDAIFTTNGGTSYARAGATAQLGGGEVHALAYGPGATAAASDWWLGDQTGQIVHGGGGAIGKAWNNVTPPGMAAVQVTCIAVHPANANYVVACTGGSPGAVVQGRVFLSVDQGANWMDVTGLATASVLGGPAPGPIATPLRSLPPCPITSVVFDPSVPPASPQVVFAGTLAGVYVIRNLPPLGGPAAAFNPDWRTFNGPGGAPLPLTLVNDLEVVTLPARPGAIANSPESTVRQRLYAAMYGRGIFVCDISPPNPPAPVGGPPHRMFLRQHVVEDGLAYPRPTPTVLNTPPAAPTYNNPQLGGDPRVPPGAVNFDDHSAYDMRVDNAPFQFFDEVLDGVEFDEELRTKNLVPGQPNVIYVQVHNAGWDRFAQTVDVHLFFAAGAAPAGGADPAPLPDLHPDFWTSFTAETLPAPVGPLPAGAAVWQRAGKKQTIPAGRLSANYPCVVRFEWTPPSSLAAGFAALLAVCTGAEDAIDAATRPLVMRDVVRQERRAAFRLVPVDPYVPDVFIRDSIEDTGQPTSGSFAGRSPDIVVAQTPLDEATAFSDLLDSHLADRIKPGGPQHIYVRVHNRRDVPVDATVEVFWTKPNAPTSAADPQAPGFDGTKWKALTPLASVNVAAIPARSWGLAHFEWPAADVPPEADPAFNAIGIVALASTTEGADDLAPRPTRVHDATSFWRFFGRTPDSNNAAFRVVLYD